MRTYTDGISGEAVWAYHAQITGLAPATSYSYAVTADNDSCGTPLRATFRTAPRGRARSGSPASATWPRRARIWALSYGRSACAVAAVESFRPLFHLLNSDLCYAA